LGLDPQIADREQALAGKPLVGHPGLSGKGLGQVPLALATDRRHDRLPLARSEGQQMPDLGARVSPRFPVAHPDAPSDPVIQAGNGPAILREAGDVGLPGRSCSAAFELCGRLPSDSPSRVCPCLERMVVVNLVDGGSPTGDFHPISTCPCRAYTSGCTRTARKLAACEPQRYLLNT